MCINDFSWESCYNKCITWPFQTLKHTIQPFIKGTIDTFIKLHCSKHGPKAVSSLVTKIIKNSLKIVTLIVISIRAYQHENRNKTVASHDPLCGLPLTHRFGSHTQLRFLRQYTDHYSTYTFSHVGTHTHTDRCGTVGERMPERGKIKRIKSVMPPLNVHWRLVSLEFHWSHFPQFTESWALVMNTQDVEVYWERWDRPKGILHLHSVTGFDFGSWKQILSRSIQTERNIKWKSYFERWGSCMWHFFSDSSYWKCY